MIKDFEIITPIIMAGTDKNKVELRIPSIKGILRWWFRFYKSSFLDVDELRNFESEVFGSTENSSLFLAIKRLSFSPSQSLELIFKFLPHFNYQKELENSLMFLSLFGGIGARWRRGFGSVQIKNFELESNTLESLSNEIIGKIKNLKGNNKPDNFMSISNTKIYLIKPKSDFWDSWSFAMDNLRDNFYRKMKNQLGMGKIAYKPSNGEREVSPVIIQIKKTKNNNYFGVVLVYEGWNKFDNFTSQISTLDNFEIKEV